jgi:hypothetical protein
MARFLRTTLVFAVACALGATVAAANVPTVEDSTVPDVMTVSPDGGIAFTVNVAGALGPVDAAVVEITVNAVSDPLVAWCVGQAHPVISGVTNPAGDATFFVEGGGCLPSASGQRAGSVKGDSVPLGLIAINSPDVVDNGGFRILEKAPPSNNCDLGTNTTTVGLGDATEHTTNIALGLVDRCSKMTDVGTYDGPVGLGDATILTVYITAGTTCTCAP